MPAVMGGALVPTAYLTARRSGCSTQASAFAGLAVLFVAAGAGRRSRFGPRDARERAYNPVQAYTTRLAVDLFHCSRSVDVGQLPTMAALVSFVTDRVAGGNVSRWQGYRAVCVGICRSFSFEWWFWLTMTGVALGLAVRYRYAL
ncbi:MAG: hypothetical protein BJ554DRAFT_253 [Olpidium bornovanus]|uniref:Uncharacterized protein n=1 Tax=Olpidium bornovanus TaxID=278681 RepID=A0A8H7ZU32_9FUNG|nr:MAG: hypothetical protein BJ554DRAFT_253 [Olpidium bornovanus]